MSVLLVDSPSPTRRSDLPATGVRRVLPSHDRRPHSGSAVVGTLVESSVGVVSDRPLHDSSQQIEEIRPWPRALHYLPAAVRYLKDWCSRLGARPSPPPARPPSRRRDDHRFFEQVELDYDIGVDTIHSN